jgi:hypothetical protein
MRTIAVQADGEHLDRIMGEWLAHLVLAIPVSPGGSCSRTYSNPYAVARVIIAGEHETVANVPAREPRATMEA